MVERSRIARTLIGTAFLIAGLASGARAQEAAPTVTHLSLIHI